MAEDINMLNYYGTVSIIKLSWVKDFQLIIQIYRFRLLKL